MELPFAWNCPYCNHDAIITNSNASSGNHFFAHGNKTGQLGLETVVVVCPNPNCREFGISVRLFKSLTTKPAHPNTPSITAIIGPPLEEWKLRPRSSSKPFPSYIPKPILDDYNEACLIVNDSPKASATLSRRCLQGMIRDFWGIKEMTLALEIKGLHGKIDTATWKAIDAIRSVGNIGAHMESDINLIVDVEAAEAAQLIGLIEFLLKDWYVGRHEREEHKRNVIALAVAKAAAKTGEPAGQ